MTTTPFKDHFSGHAAAYASARPLYPELLFDFLADVSPSRDVVWDCATGNGQAAQMLVSRFSNVIATDASEQQIAAARGPDNIEYRVAAAERSGLAGDSVDLVTVAQALHWFDLGDFFAEVDRVLKPGGVLAVWCYGLCHVAPEVDRIVLDCYEALDDWWPPERQIVERGYSDITLPFDAIECPVFSMHADWDADAMLAYLETWSATKRCFAETGRDAVQEIADKLRAAWGGQNRAAHWPLYLKACRRS